MQLSWRRKPDKQWAKKKKKGIQRKSKRIKPSKKEDETKCGEVFPLSSGRDPHPKRGDAKWGGGESLTGHRSMETHCDQNQSTVNLGKDWEKEGFHPANIKPEKKHLP